MKNNPNREIILEEHNPEWLQMFTEEKRDIQNLFGQKISVEHVGSTCISDLISKPIIDILIGIENLNESKKIIEILENKLDYHYDSKLEKLLPFRRHLWKGNNEVHYFHIWIVKKNSKDWNDLIYFREYLKSNPNAKEEYNKAKKDLIKNKLNTRDKYIHAKSKTYNKLLEEAWIFMGKTKQ